VPTRFMFILLGPPGDHQKNHEIGRSIATLMSDEVSMSVLTDVYMSQYEEQGCSEVQIGCLGGAVVERWTRDRKVAGSTPGRDAIKSTRSTQPSIPPG